MGADGNFELYEDEGRGFAYKQGAYRWTPITLSSSANGACHTLTIAAAEGQNFNGALNSRSWELSFKGIEEPQTVTVNGNTPIWSYRAASQTVTIDTNNLSTNSPVTVNLNTGSCN